MKRGFLIQKPHPRPGASHSAKGPCTLKQETSEPKRLTKKKETKKYIRSEYVQNTGMYHSNSSKGILTALNLIVSDI